jgi:hypothetical protein
VSDYYRKRREALRRLRPPDDELFGRGNSGQWARYVRGNKTFADKTVFAAWDEGSRHVSLGAENTGLFTREQAAEVLLTVGPTEAKVLARLFGSDR